MELLYRDEDYAIVGRAIEVHRELGCGFLEAVYHEAMQVELEGAGISVEPCKELRISYKGRLLKKTYIADLVCSGKIIVELKAIDQLTGRDEAQILNYLKATGLRVGLLINVGSDGKLEWKRFVR
jgi:GxxExxY protein